MDEQSPDNDAEQARPERPQAGERDPRVLIALGAGTVLAAIVAVVVLLGGSGDPEEASAAAPQRCLRAWNADPEAIAYGQHNFGSHGYERVQVRMLDESAEEPAAGESGVCAVIFGALELDNEPVAAGEMLVGGIWSPISLQPGVELNEVAELQAIAAGEPNSSLTGEGKLVAN